MPGTIKALVAKLKNRRKSRLWRYRKAGQGREEEGGEETKGLTKQMAGLSLDQLEGRRSVIETNAKMQQHVFGTADFKFEFGFSSTYVSWPGPSYDESSQFAPGIFDKPRHPKRRPKQKSSKRRLSQEERPAVNRRNQQPVSPPVKAVTRISKTSKWPQYHGVPPPREPPNHLLSLPGEIRNEVYRLLCLSTDPISAQFRLIIKPKQGRKKKAETMRRFPQEPLLALCCKQLRQEVLSFFYSENKFVFHRSEYPKLNGIQNTLSMTTEENVRLWGPKGGFADSLRHVELHFRAREPSFKTFCISYTFSKLANGRIDLEHNAHSVEYCSDFEDRMLEHVNSELECDHECKDLVTVAANFLRYRKDQLREDASMSSEYPYSIYRPKEAICSGCGLDTLREIGSGL